MKKIISADYLRSILEYNKDTGAFIWLVDRKKVMQGSVAGAKNKGGYNQIQIDGVKYRACRLAWFYVHGKWPNGVIDHIDGNNQNDAFGNLRDVTQRVNLQNQSKAQSSNKSGRLGVSKHYGKYEARIRIDGKQIRLGNFETEELAHQAYLAAKREFHEGNTL